MNDYRVEDTYPAPGRISPATARRMLEQGALLVDVRTPSEYRERHLEGAVNIPLQLLSARLHELRERGVPVIVYCRSGSRSAVAMLLLREQGLKHVYDAGSIRDW